MSIKKERKNKKELEIGKEKVKEARKDKQVKKVEFEKVHAHQDQDSSDCSSAAETEDEEGALITPAIDAQILHTIAEIRAKDQKIYDPSREFFNPDELSQAQREWRERMSKRDKPIRLLDLKQKEMLGLEQDDAADIHQGEGLKMTMAPGKAFEEEQARLKARFKDFDQDDDGEDFLVKKDRTGEDAEREEKEYCEFLLEQLSHNKHAGEAMQSWLEYRGESTQTANDNERFLMDYVLNRRWIEPKSKKGDSAPAAAAVVQDPAPLSEDEEWVEGAEEWEAKLNFRFEQADGDQIISYPRNIDDSLRREESSRKRQREAKLERKQQEKIRQEEELKRLKQKKRAEIAAQIAEIERVAGKTGSENEKLAALLEESDFDPAEHDQRMQALFNDDYYEGEDDEYQDEAEAEEGDDDLEETGDYEGDNGLDLEDYDNGQDGQKSNVDEKVARLLEEYYGLDYEEKIGDLACRFKYTQVPAASFGLTAQDILAADDADLNRHVSLKKLAPYRPTKELERDLKRFGDKRRAYQFRKNLLTKQGVLKEDQKLEEKTFQASKRHAHRDMVSNKREGQKGEGGKRVGKRSRQQ